MVTNAIKPSDSSGGFLLHVMPPKKEAYTKKKKKNPTEKQKQKHLEKQTSKKPKRCQLTNAEREQT